jgi:hypothetical protein
MEIEIRNIKEGNGYIDCEINHPKFGWIPFTARPDDVELHGREIYAFAKKKIEEGENDDQ